MDPQLNIAIRLLVECCLAVACMARIMKYDHKDDDTWNPCDPWRLQSVEGVGGLSENDLRELLRFSAITGVLLGPIWNPTEAVQVWLTESRENRQRWKAENEERWRQEAEEYQRQVAERHQRQFA